MVDRYLPSCLGEIVRQYTNPWPDRFNSVVRQLAQIDADPVYLMYRATENRLRYILDVWIIAHFCEPNSTIESLEATRESKMADRISRRWRTFGPFLLP